MPHQEQFLLFLAAAFLLAIVPGPGILYVVGRTLAAGRRDGIASTGGTALGGLVHVIAAAVGLSALILASAQLFALIKLAGAGYLIWIGVKTLWSVRQDAASMAAISTTETAPHSLRQALRDGALVEALNPKTAAFFLAFLPQFVALDRGHLWLQFLVLGCISVAMNTAADLLAVIFAGAFSHLFAGNARLMRRFRTASGTLFIALGASLLLTRRPAH